MTIAISVKVNDGVVLAADSASTLMQVDENGDPLSVVNVYDNAEKVYNLCKGLPIGAVTWGQGGIGRESISTLTKDFRKLLDDPKSKLAFNKIKYQVKDVAKKFADFFFSKYAAVYSETENPPELGFIVAGYSTGEPLAEEYLIVIKNGKLEGPTEIRPKDQGGAAWFGQPEAIFRLIKGYSGFLPGLLEQMGVQKGDIELIVAEAQKHIEAPHIHDAMPIQDAIDLAKFLVQTTIGYVRFNPGPQTVGGPTDLAAITKHEGFKWVDRKYYYKSAFNPEVQDESRR